ncbi:DUF6010 family protein [Phormidium tenue]|uniref:Uncharacterized protein n=1 Tax=Phormidium tenue NIES-30 TaxID=549789 RepID=A0A1U7JAV3_9CYAN|nr:DUF6010 family protein [Phormidium tenue]MBD2230342.1 hypothetical protein [Phormidium tenue FACHB-1052]OKH50856.1 hypothetical protein NIES30_01880 [Phormidium tenue NIES-30]
MIALTYLLLGALGAVVFLGLAAQSPQENRILALGLGIAAVLYIAFAWIGQASAAWVVTEMGGALGYGVAAGLGLYRSRWWLMLGWLAHPLWDVGLHVLGRGSAFAPQGYAISCISFDLVVAIYILITQLTRSRATPDPISALSSLKS